MSSLHGRWILSGGLASGKSRVRGLLEASGVHTIDADSYGHRVLEPGGPAFGEVVDRWPQAVEEGEIDRSALAGIVFADHEQLAALETITHPHIFDMISHEVEENSDATVVVEMPLLNPGLGAGWQRLVVDAKPEACLERAVARGMARSDAKSRLDAQPSRREWLAVADLVLPNHGEVHELDSAVEVLLRHL